MTPAETSMSLDFWAALIGQTIIIVTAIVAAFIRTERRITRVETKIEHLEQIEALADQERTTLDMRVQGISRAVARLEGVHQYCPYIKPPTGPHRPPDSL